MANPTPRAGYRTLPRMTGFDGHRRVIAPGIFEYSRDLTLLGQGIIPHVNVLQSDAHCHKVLTGRQETRRFETAAHGINVDIGNVPGNDGEGEGRLAIDVVDMALVKKAQAELGQGETWWSKWYDIIKSKAEREDEMVMFTLLDGHCGAHVAELVQKTLHAAIAWAMWSDAQATAGQEDAILRVL